MKEIETAMTASVVVLSVCPSEAEDTSLERIVHGPGWRLYTQEQWTLIQRFTLDSAFSVLQSTTVPIIVCEAELLPGTWREMLDHISALPDPPLLIVTSRWQMSGYGRKP
jgi:hypothetical protein